MTIQIEGFVELLDPLTADWHPFSKLLVVNGSHTIKPLGLSEDHKLRVTGTDWGGRVQGRDFTGGFLDYTPTEIVNGLKISGHTTLNEELTRSYDGVWSFPLVKK